MEQFPAFPVCINPSLYERLQGIERCVHERLHVLPLWNNMHTKGSFKVKRVKRVVFGCHEKTSLKVLLPSFDFIGEWQSISYMEGSASGASTYTNYRGGVCTHLLQELQWKLPWKEVRKQESILGNVGIQCPYPQPFNISKGKADYF